MADDWPFALGRLFCLFCIALLTCSARADPDTAVDLTLKCPDYVASHAPLVWLHSDDPYMPTDLQTHILHTTAMLDGKPIPNLPPLNLDNLEILNEYGGRVALTSNDDPTKPDFPEWLLGEAPDETGKIHNSTPCVVILVDRSPTDVDAFYFYFYAFNEGANITQVMEPFDRFIGGGKAASGMHFGNHIGDWEHNMVRFQDGKPIGIYYSQHIDGRGYYWDDSTLNITDDGRPIVYSGRGAHANYPEPGHQIHNEALFDYCDEGKIWDPVLSAYFYRFDPATFTLTRLNPPNQESSSPPTSNLTSFFYFTGLWGDRRWPDSDPRQLTVPRFGLKRFRDGPTGPRHKHLVRKGLTPDHMRKLGWMEWSVGVYMWLYPCCLKGWRAWITTGVIVVFLSGIVLAIRFGVRRMRGGISTYKKLQTEDMQLDDWGREDEALFSSSDDESD
ncbi:vacuolar protein sorting-associated protein 62 [Thelonectria olida]|uniref:Vacuolar protein sorting-associated protein 62 n=1 Tax=Thelonectria olida TaxID=1576542 RepID=A0A9P8WA82_9HYPO|nr:vacuolar protein sorting-associated protein 62 [Thelonectria olida]